MCMDAEKFNDELHDTFVTLVKAVTDLAVLASTSDDGCQVIRALHVNAVATIIQPIIAWDTLRLGLAPEHLTPRYREEVAAILTKVIAALETHEEAIVPDDWAEQFKDHD